MQDYIFENVSHWYLWESILFTLKTYKSLHDCFIENNSIIFPIVSARDAEILSKTTEIKNGTISFDVPVSSTIVDLNTIILSKMLSFGETIYNDSFLCDYANTVYVEDDYCKYCPARISHDHCLNGLLLKFHSKIEYVKDVKKLSIKEFGELLSIGSQIRDVGIHSGVITRSIIHYLQQNYNIKHNFPYTCGDCKHWEELPNLANIVLNNCREKSFERRFFNINLSNVWGRCNSPIVAHYGKICNKSQLAISCSGLN